MWVTAALSYQDEIKMKLDKHTNFSSPLTEADYIHTHAMKNTTTGEVYFITSFPSAGKYKLWEQFNRNGKIVTADFWVNVE